MLSRRNIAIALIAVFLFGSFATWRISKARCFQLVGDLTCRINTDDKVVALSFDDGPTPQGVDAVLAPLHERGVTATFFLIGDSIEKYPGQAKRLLDAGHELANHSYSHTRMIGKSAATYDAEIARTDRLLKAEGAADPVLFRPPFGKRLIGLPLAIERAGYQTIMWDVEDDAEHYPAPADYARHIIRQVKPGSIILIHPMYRSNQTARAALPLLLDGLVAQGYRIVPVGELLREKSSSAL